LHLEQTLHIAMPAELREIYLETDGVSLHPAFFDEVGEEECNLQILWTLDEIHRENLEFRNWAAGLESATLSFNNLLFFASLPNGDPIGFVVHNAEIIEPQIIVMSHEDWKDRRLLTMSLREYLTTLLETCQ